MNEFFSTIFPQSSAEGSLEFGVEVAQVMKRLFYEPTEHAQFRRRLDHGVSYQVRHPVDSRIAAPTDMATGNVIQADQATEEQSRPDSQPPIRRRCQVAVRISTTLRHMENMAAKKVYCSAGDAENERSGAVATLAMDRPVPTVKIQEPIRVSS